MRFGWIAVAYVVAVGVAAGIVESCALHPLLEVALADVAATLVIYAFSLGLRNASVYDPYWSVAPVAIALWLPAAEPHRRWLLVALVTLWSLRLTANWATGWRGVEDWRYRDLAAQTGRAWPLVNLFGVHLFPTVLVYLGCLPLWAALQRPEPLGALDLVAAGVTVGAIALEATADLQLRGRTAGRVMDRGLWAWSRHPNYLGELGFWLGLYLFALPAWWTGVGFAAMVGLFVGVSVPLMEQRLADRPGYAEYQRRVPRLLPWPR